VTAVCDRLHGGGFESYLREQVCGCLQKTC
jgi:hypothetical protein